MADIDAQACEGCGIPTTSAQGVCSTCRTKGKPCLGCGGWTGQSARKICPSCYRKGEEAIYRNGFRDGTDAPTVANAVNVYREQHGISGRHPTISPGGIVFKYAKLGLITEEELRTRYETASKAKSRANARARSPGWTKIRMEALERDGRKCAVCSSENDIEVHHIEQFSLVKKHELHNLIPLCEPCHHLFGKERIFIKYEMYEAGLAETRRALLKYEAAIAKLGWRLMILGVINHIDWKSSVLVRPVRSGDNVSFSMCKKHYHLVAEHELKDHRDPVIEIPRSAVPLVLIKDRCEHGCPHFSAYQWDKFALTKTPPAESELPWKEQSLSPLTSARAPSRNEPCPCGSGKKFKRCCGLNAPAATARAQQPMSDIPSIH